MAITTYPAWTNYPLYVQETNDFVKYCRSMFGKNQKELTVSAMLEAERIAKDSSVKGYRDVDEFFADLDND